MIKAIRHGSKFDVVSSALVLHGLLGARMGARHRAARALWRRQLLERVSARRIQARQLGLPLASWGKITGQIHYMFLPVVCYMVGSFATLTILVEELADGEPRPGLRAHGVREGAAASGA